MVVSVAAPLILGDTSNKDGYIKLILITVAVILFCSIIGTLGVKERIKPQKEKSYTIKQLFQILSQKPVYITFLVVLLYTIGNNIVSAVNTYYYTYVLGNLSWAAILTLVMCVTIFPATMIVTKFIAKYGKKKMYAVGLAIVGLCPLIRLIDVKSIPILIVSSLIAGVGSGFAAPLNYGSRQIIQIMWK